MHLIKLSDITIEKLKNRELKEIIPEFYELEGIVENNSGHINDPVVTHVLSVLTEFGKLLDSADKKVRDYLAGMIDSHSKMELFYFVTVFHDIGKKETIKKDGDIVTFPGHEKVGAEKVKKILSMFDLSENERELVVEVIANHGFFHCALDHPRDNLEEKIERFKKEHPDTFLGVVLLTKADILGGQLRERNPEKFNFKIDFLSRIINNY